MPKASCQVCKESMPLHILALHVNNCVKSQSTEEEDETDVQLLSVMNSPSFCREPLDMKQDMKECPICLCCFPVNEIAQHASLCGERPEDTSTHMTDVYVSTDSEWSVPSNRTDPLTDLVSEADVLQWLSSQVDTSKDFRICITRNDLVQRGFIQWQRQKKGSPINKLHVTFIGEAGIDTGALSKEFLTEMMDGIETRLFEGSGKKGKSHVYSISDLENSFYRTAGEVFSVSLAQGGPPPCFLRSWCYQFLATGNFDALKLTKDDVDDTEYRSLIEKVEVADNLTDLTEDIVSCGYTGLVKLDKRDSIIRSIVVHATVRLTPMLQQIRTGMKIYNLLEVIGRHESLCSNLFVPRDENDDTAPDEPEEDLSEREELAAPAEELSKPEQELSEPEEPSKPAEELSKPEELSELVGLAPPEQELNEPEGLAPPAEELGEREEPRAPAERPEPQRHRQLDTVASDCKADQKPVFPETPSSSCSLDSSVDLSQLLHHT
ncbi:unnamed protein product [Oreochromis niloticus]|nr:unnamed protein product [Mustela putorius furo]